MATDCVPCHFDYEEEKLLPFLPPYYQGWLLREHATLKAHGYPAAEVIAHAEREMPIFARYCPPALVAEVEADHRRFHPTLEHYAGLGLNAPTKAIA